MIVLKKNDVAWKEIGFINEKKFIVTAGVNRRIRWPS
ncbi:Uncharacterised protein [Yersinia intermedia]|nr:Uncharacterised protein [Yersinia intermedia]